MEEDGVEDVVDEDEVGEGDVGGDGGVYRMVRFLFFVGWLLLHCRLFVC